MTDHRQKLIIMQTLVKEILPVVLNQPGTRWLDDGIREETEKWCHWCYELAGRIGPQERDDDQKRMHTQTFNKYRRMADKAISRDDSLAMVEIRDELTENKHWADFMRRLYSEQAKEVERLVAEGDRLAFEQDEDYLEMQE